LGLLAELSLVPRAGARGCRCGGGVVARDSMGRRRAADKKGVCFGSEPLTGGQRRQTATALEDCEVMQFKVDDLDPRSAKGGHSIATKIFENFVDAELRQMAIFEGLTRRIIRAVAPLFVLEEHTEGASIFSEGDDGDKFYILVHGRIEIRKADVLLAEFDTRTQARSHLFFGEMALLDGKPRMASAVAMSPCKLLTLTKPRFRTFLLYVSDFKQRVRREKAVRKANTEIKMITGR